MNSWRASKLTGCPPLVLQHKSADDFCYAVVVVVIFGNVGAMSLDVVVGVCHDSADGAVSIMESRFGHPLRQWYRKRNGKLLAEAFDGPSFADAAGHMLQVHGIGKDPVHFSLCPFCRLFFKAEKLFMILVNDDKLYRVRGQGFGNIRHHKSRDIGAGAVILKTGIVPLCQNRGIAVCLAVKASSFCLLKYPCYVGYGDGFLKNTFSWYIS